MRIAHATRDAVPAPALLATTWASVGLGVAGLAVVAASPAPVVAVLAGTAGMAAAAAGVAVLQAARAHRASSPSTGWVPAIGIVTGALAALLLVTQLGVTLLGSSGPAPERRVVVATTAAPSRAMLTGSVNALAYLLATARTGDGAWPAGLAVTGDGRVYATSGPNVGHLLLQAPAGASVSYVVSRDRSRCTLVMRAAADPRLVVRFSSTTGLSTND